MLPPDSSKSFGVMSLRCLFFHCSLHGLDRCVEIHLTFLSSVRGEAVRLYHVWHEVYPTLPTGEAQSHSHRYVAHFLELWSCFPWLPSCCMRSISLVTWLLQTQIWVAFLSLRCQMLMFHASAGSFINISIVASGLCVWNDMMIEPKGQHHSLAFRCM